MIDWLKQVFGAAVQAARAGHTPDSAQRVIDDVASAYERAHGMAREAREAIDYAKTARTAAIRMMQTEIAKLDDLAQKL